MIAPLRARHSILTALAVFGVTLAVAVAPSAADHTADDPGPHGGTEEPMPVYEDGSNTPVRKVPPRKATAAHVNAAAKDAIGNRFAPNPPVYLSRLCGPRPIGKSACNVRVRIDGTAVFKVRLRIKVTKQGPTIDVAATVVRAKLVKGVLHTPPPGHRD